MATNELLFRRLSETDFNAVNGKAQQAGTGGGAMHIALGVHTDRFPIKNFIGVTTATKKTIATEPWVGHFGDSELTFDGNPARRNGEWRIADQFHHRHPAWTGKEGFPTVYDPNDKPIAIVIRMDGDFHVRLLTEQALDSVPPSLNVVLTGPKDKGITFLQPEWAAHFELLASDSPLSEVVETTTEAQQSAEDDFIPPNGEDARKRKLREVVHRQGQPKFRKQLMKAYAAKCAISGCTLVEVLEAAHITPYMGPDTNKVKNGLLLRADIHTLFDLGLISIDPDTLRIRLSSLIQETEYKTFAGKRIHLPGEPTLRPSKAALEEHLKDFQE